MVSYEAVKKISHYAENINILSLFDEFKSDLTSDNNSRSQSPYHYIAQKDKNIGVVCINGVDSFIYRKKGGYYTYEDNLIRPNDELKEPYKYFDPKYLMSENNKTKTLDSECVINGFDFITSYDVMCVDQKKAKN